MQEFGIRIYNTRNPMNIVLLVSIDIEEYEIDEVYKIANYINNNNYQNISTMMRVIVLRKKEKSIQLTMDFED